MASVNVPPTRERVFTLEGLLLLSMFVELPIGTKVRRWLRKLGKQVMVEGYAMGPGMERVLAGINQTMQMLVVRMDKIEEKAQAPVVAVQVTSVFQNCRRPDLGIRCG